MIAQKAAPLILQLVAIGIGLVRLGHLKDIQKARVTQFVYKYLAVLRAGERESYTAARGKSDTTHLDLGKLAGYQLGEAAILALEYLPNVLQIADARLACAQHGFLLDLRE